MRSRHQLSNSVRPLKSQLDAINRVIEAAAMTWNLPQRVKRLSLSSHRSTALEFNHFEMVGVDDGMRNIIGVAACEQADAEDTRYG